MKRIAGKKPDYQSLLIIGLGVLFLALVFLARMLSFRRNSEKLQHKTKELENNN
jgi:hypothetical protein